RGGCRVPGGDRCARPGPRRPCPLSARRARSRPGPAGSRWPPAPRPGRRRTRRVPVRSDRDDEGRRTLAAPSRVAGRSDPRRAVRVLMVAASAPGMHRTEAVMGTMVSLEVREPSVDPGAVDAAFALLHEIDARFSPFKADSEISRLANGELAEADCSLDVRQVLAACDHLAATTNGAFDARYHRPDGRLDPSGFVKGWALEEAGWLLESAGARNYWLNAGGDIVARGGSEPGLPWRVGIRHPDRPDRVGAALSVRDRAVATSGAYERGDHIVDPLSMAAPVGLRSVTVVGPALAFTDAFATAIYVMGLSGLDWIMAEPDYAALVITDDDRSIWTPGMEPYFVRED